MEHASNFAPAFPQSVHDKSAGSTIDFADARAYLKSEGAA